MSGTRTRALVLLTLVLAGAVAPAATGAPSRPPAEPLAGLPARADDHGRGAGHAPARAGDPGGSPDPRRPDRGRGGAMERALAVRDRRGDRVRLRDGRNGPRNRPVDGDPIPRSALRLPQARGARGAQALRVDPSPGCSGRTQLRSPLPRSRLPPIAPAPTAPAPVAPAPVAPAPVAPGAGSARPGSSRRRPPRPPRRRRSSRRSSPRRGSPSDRKPRSGRARSSCGGATSSRGTTRRRLDPGGAERTIADLPLLPARARRPARGVGQAAREAYEALRAGVFDQLGWSTADAGGPFALAGRNQST